MAKQKRVRVSSGEQELLSMLWSCQSLTLAKAHAEFPRFGKPVSYPTMQTRLNRLVDKGLAARSRQRPARYSALVTKDDVVAGQVGQLLERFGRPQLIPLVAELIREPSLTDDELAELQRLLATVEQRKKATSKSKRGNSK